MTDERNYFMFRPTIFIEATDLDKDAVDVAESLNDHLVQFIRGLDESFVNKFIFEPGEIVTKMLDKCPRDIVFKSVAISGDDDQ